MTRLYSYLSHRNATGFKGCLVTRLFRKSILETRRPPEVIPAQRLVCLPRRSTGSTELARQCWWSHELGKSVLGLAPPETAVSLCTPCAEVQWPNSICPCVLGLLNPISEPQTLVLVKHDRKSKFLCGGVYSPALSRNFPLLFRPQVAPCFSVKKSKTNSRKTVGVF